MAYFLKCMVSCYYEISVIHHINEVEMKVLNEVTFAVE